MWRNATRALLLVVLGTVSAAAQERPGEVIDLAFPVVELRFPVEDMAAKVQTLQVKETATETRIELPADILFDFDKFDIRPSAAEALKQAADVLRQRARDRPDRRPHRLQGHAGLQSDALAAAGSLGAAMAR